MYFFNITQIYRKIKIHKSPIKLQREKDRKKLQENMQK